MKEKKYKNGQYNTGYQLTVEEIKQAAMLQVGSDVYIGSINNHTGGDSIDEGFFPDITAAKQAAADGKPAFLSFTDGKHYVLVALIPDKNTPSKISVVYANSLTDVSNPLSTTGLAFANALASSLGAHIEVKSVDQQYDECCGLSVAANIATIAAQHKANQPIAISSITSDKKKFYQKMGREAFDYDKRIKDAIVSGDFEEFKKVCKEAEDGGLDLKSISFGESKTNLLQLALQYGRLDIFEYLVEDKGLVILEQFDGISRDLLNPGADSLFQNGSGMIVDEGKLKEAQKGFFEILKFIRDNVDITDERVINIAFLDAYYSDGKYALTIANQHTNDAINSKEVDRVGNLLDIAIASDKPSDALIDELIKKEVGITPRAFELLGSAILNRPEKHAFFLKYFPILFEKNNAALTEELILKNYLAVFMDAGFSEGLIIVMALGVVTEENLREKFEAMLDENASKEKFNIMMGISLDDYCKKIAANKNVVDNLDDAKKVDFIRTIHKYSKIVSDPIELDRLAFIINQKHSCDEYKEWMKVAKDFGDIFPFNIITERAKIVEPSKQIKDAIIEDDLIKVRCLCKAAKDAGIDLNNFTLDTKNAGFNFMAPDDYYLTHALLNGRDEIFKYLVEEAGIKLENSCLGQLVMNKDFQCRDKFKAEHDGALKILQYLRAKITTKKDIDGSKLLEFAAFFGDLDTVKHCLDNNGDPNIQCARGTTPIFNAFNDVWEGDPSIYKLLMDRADLKYHSNMLGLIMQPLILEASDNYNKAQKYFTDLVLKFPKDITQADIFAAASNLAGLGVNPTFKKENLKLLLLTLTSSSGNIDDDKIEALIMQICAAKYHIPQLQSEEGIKKMLGANAEAIRNVADDKREELLDNIIEYTEIVADPVKLKAFAHALIHDYDSAESVKYRGLIFSAGKFFPLDIIEEEKRKVRADYMLELNIKIALLKGGYVAEGDDVKLTEYTNNMKATLQALPQYQNITAAPLIYKAVEDLMSTHLSKGIVGLIETVRKKKTHDDAKALIQVASTQKMTLSDEDRFKSNQTQIESNVFEFLRGAHTKYTADELENELAVAIEYQKIYELLGKLKDAKDGVYWYEYTNLDGTKHLIRDARGRDSNSSVDSNSIYGRAMILMNTCRATEYLSPKLKKQIQNIRKEILDKVTTGEEFDYEVYNRKIINLLLTKGEKAEDIQQKLKVTNEFLHLRDDTQHHVTTISSAKKAGIDISVIETDTMVVGLTAKQRKMYQELLNEPDKLKNNSDYQWFFAMKEYEQKLTIECIPAILEGKGVIPTQLRKHLPGFRNAHCRSISIYEGGEVKKVLEAFRTGTLSYLGKDKANAVSITEENIKQFMHLTGRMPVVNDMLSSADKQEGAKPQKLMDAAAKRARAHRATTPFNLLRLISRKNYEGHLVILGTLANKVSDQDVKTFLQTGVGEKEAREALGKITPEDFRKELENAVNARANMEKYFALHGLERYVRKCAAIIVNPFVSMVDKIFQIKLPKIDVPVKTNLSAQIAADMVNVLFSLTNENGELRKIIGATEADQMALIIMCMSGKDRTQIVLAEASRRALEMQGVDDPAKVVAINSGHAQHMAQDNGGTRGCFGIQRNSAGQATEGLQEVKDDLGQKTAKFNKMAYGQTLVEKVVSHAERLAEKINSGVSKLRR